MSVTFLRCEKAPNNDYDITVIIEKIFSTNIKTFRGSCTVFHEVGTGTRPGTFMESTLSNMLEKWKQENEL